MSKEFERGMEASQLAADYRWTMLEQYEVDLAIRSVARRASMFTTDAVWTALGPEFPVTKGIGSRMRKAQRDGLLENTGETMTSRRRGEHGHAQRLVIWRSLIWTGE